MAIGRKPAAAKLACCGSQILAPPPMPCRNTTDWRGGAPRPCRSSIMAALTPCDANKPRRHEEQFASPPQSKIVPRVKLGVYDCYAGPWIIQCPVVERVPGIAAFVMPRRRRFSCDEGGTGMRAILIATLAAGGICL